MIYLYICEYAHMYMHIQHSAKWKLTKFVSWCKKQWGGGRGRLEEGCWQQWTAMACTLFHKFTVWFLNVREISGKSLSPHSSEFFEWRLSFLWNSVPCCMNYHGPTSCFLFSWPLLCSLHSKFIWFLKVSPKKKKELLYIFSKAQATVVSNDAWRQYSIPISVEWEDNPPLPWMFCPVRLSPWASVHLCKHLTHSLVGRLKQLVRKTNKKEASD